MATASPTEGRFAQVLQCPICLETLRRPKILPCRHTYCNTCLQSHISRTLINRGTPRVCFPCPVCSADTTLPDTAASVDQWAEVFPVNSFVSSVLDVSLETYGEKFCDLCLKWNRETSAKLFCKDCKRFLCTLCKEHHNETLSRISHDVVDLSTDYDTSISIPSLSTVEKCLRHLNKNIEFYCMDHSSLCCNTCGFLEHRKCERVIPIDDMIKTFDAKAKSNYLEANIRNIREHMKEITSKIKENTDDIENDKSAILDQIRSLRSELNVKLQKLEDGLIASLEENHKAEDLTLHNQEARGQSLISAICSDLTQLDLVMTHGSEVQKVIMLHNMEKNQNRYFKATSEYQEELRCIKIGLEVNKNLHDLINDLYQFGQITVTRSQTKLPPCPLVTVSEPIAETVSEFSREPLKDRQAVKVSELKDRQAVKVSELKDRQAVKVSELKDRQAVKVSELKDRQAVKVSELKDRQAVKVSEFSVKLLDDKLPCYISDVLILYRAKHVFVDWSNEKIKVYEENCLFHVSMKLQGNPWNACILPDNNLAVTLPFKKTILVFGMDNKMHIVRKIKTRLQCWGIAVMKDQLVITTGGDEHCILILYINGPEIRTVRPDNYQSDKLLNPFYVKINKSETIIYVSYNNGNKMVAYNTSWNVLFTYTDQDMNGPRGIDTDREGNIFLCGYSSFNVHQISTDGKLIKVLITKKEDMKVPLTIKFYRDMDRFYVTYLNCDVVEMYDMCH